MATWLALCLVCCADGGADSVPVSEFIERLGSPRFVEREAASDALASMGRDALAPLRAVRNSVDAEVQNRIEGVIDRIEREQLTSSTVVQFDTGEYALGQLFRELEDQTGFSLRVDPGDQPDWLTDKIRWKSAEPIPFWEAMERLRLDGSWTIDQDTSPFRLRGTPIFNVTPARSRVRSSLAGPFRFAFREPRLVPRGDAPRGTFGAGGGRARSAIGTMLQLTIELVCEPRMQVRPNGEARLVEAVDERGKSLLPGGAEAVMTSMEAWGTHEPALTLVGQIELPEPAGTRIAKVRGVVPVDIQARRLEPIEIAIDPAGAPASQAPVWCGDVTFISCGLADAPFERTPVVEIVIQPEGWSQISPLMFRRRFRGGNFAEQLAQTVERVVANLSIADSDGRVIPHGPSRQMRPMPDGLHLFVPLSAPLAPATPHRVLYHGTLRETMDLRFEFANIPTVAVTAR